MGNSGGSLEHQNAGKSKHSKDYDHEVSERNKDYWKCTRGHGYYILEKNLSTFCVCPKMWGKTEFKSEGLTT
jgi:hypothetical protein